MDLKGCFEDHVDSFVEMEAVRPKKSKSKSSGKSQVNESSLI